ncbi:MAG: gamma-glutamylcyclotransferase family protein [Kiritimatiellia bacterium]
MSLNLFAYGTLQHPRILSFVLGRIPPSFPATLKDHARYAIRNEDYPGLIPEAGACTDGTVFLGIEPGEWEKLDRYESDLYQRLPVMPVTAEGKTLQAEAYILPTEHQHLLSQELWELNQYQPNPQP